MDAVIIFGTLAALAFLIVEAHELIGRMITRRNRQTWHIHDIRDVRNDLAFVAKKPGSGANSPAFPFLRRLWRKLIRREYLTTKR